MMDLDRLKTTAGLDVKAKRVIVRADLNVPVKDGKVTDATRLERLVPGLQDLTRRGARVVVISHFGRPKGGPDPQFSLKPVADKLGQLLARPVAFAGDCVGEVAERTVAALQPGQIAVLENLRFHKGEEKNESSSPGAWRRWATSSSTMPSPPRIVRTPRRMRLRACCRPMPGRC